MKGSWRHTMLLPWKVGSWTIAFSRLVLCSIPFPCIADALTQIDMCRASESATCRPDRARRGRRPYQGAGWSLSVVWRIRALLGDISLSFRGKNKPSLFTCQVIMSMLYDQLTAVSTTLLIQPLSRHKIVVYLSDIHLSTILKHLFSIVYRKSAKLDYISWYLDLIREIIIPLKYNFPWVFHFEPLWCKF